jgi:hypothetical protein
LSAARLKTQLLRSLDSYLTPLGFRRVSDKFFGDRYYRDERGVRQGFHVSTRARGDALEAELPYVTVRFAPVEEMVASLEEPHPLTTPAGIAARATLTVLTSSHGGFMRNTWMIRNPDEAGQVAEQIANQAIAKGIPVFKTFSNPEQALAILAADDEQARSYSAPDEVRAKKAVALAFLLHGKEAATQIANVKFGRLRGEGLSTFTLWMDKLFLSSSAEAH